MCVSIQEMLRRVTKRYPKYFGSMDEWDFHYVIFDQTWGNSMMGIYGPYATLDCVTKAPTLVVLGAHSADVFFGGLYAYSCEKTNKAFMEDLSNQILVGQRKAPEKYQSFMDPDIVSEENKDGEVAQ